MRPDKDTYFLRMAELVATRSTCLRRAVGAVAVSARGHVLGTGYNGVPSGFPHCNHHDPFHETGYPHACAGATAPSGTALDTCNALHAEQNMLLQCKDVYEIDTVYCTTEPCITCTKLLLNTSCRRVVFLDCYPSGGREIWLSRRNEDTWLQKGVQSS
jgi:dCMP deaminase